MNLETTIDMLAAHLRIDPVKLMEYMREADSLGIGGYHWKAENSHNANGVQWPSGSVWWVEGAILYALVRYYKFEAVAEIGGFWGCSATHMAAAMAANGGGTVYSVDAGILGAQHGALIPPEYRLYVKLVKAWGDEWLAEQADNSLGLVFSDADHATETTRLLAEAIKPKLIDGGLLVEHDAGHDFYVDGTGTKYKDPAEVGAKVRAGLDAAAIPYRVYLTEPSDCGLGIAQINHVKTQLGRGEPYMAIDWSLNNVPVDDSALFPEIAALETDDSPLDIDESLIGQPMTIEKPKRTRRKRNAVTGKLE